MVLALDLSDDVSQLDCERMRDILLSLLMKMEISGNNCPTDARVAVVSYSNGTDYLARLSDRKRRPVLLQAVRGLSPAGSSGSRHLGDAVRFVARHVFKPRACRPPPEEGGRVLPGGLDPGCGFYQHRHAGAQRIGHHCCGHHFHRGPQPPGCPAGEWGTEAGWGSRG